LAKKNEKSSSARSLPLVIVNPKSAGGSTDERWAQTASDLRTHFGPFEVEFTRKQGDGIEMAAAAAKAGCDFIIACGGDGTINEVANGILLSGCDTELGVLPSGTGGDFRRTIGMPLSHREAARSLRSGQTKLIDAGKVTFQDFDNQTVSRFFLNVSSFGLAAEIIERVKASTTFSWLPLKSVRGRAGFALSTLQEVIDLEPVTIRIRVNDGDEKTLNTINFCVANARYFGGGMKIAPDAKLNDGLLDIINIGDLGMAKILINAYSLYTGSHLSLDEVHSALAAKVEVSSANQDREIRLETDGELPGKLPASFEAVPNALRVRVPKQK
jgi:diacylglycerol kinase (ATP)